MGPDPTGLGSYKKRKWGHQKKTANYTQRRGQPCPHLTACPHLQPPQATHPPHSRPGRPPPPRPTVPPSNRTVHTRLPGCVWASDRHGYGLLVRPCWVFSFFARTVLPPWAASPEVLWGPGEPPTAPFLSRVAGGPGVPGARSSVFEA